MNNNIFSWKPQGNSFLLVKFVDKIRFNYSNSFPEKNAPFVSKRKNLRFQKNVSFHRARVYIVLKQENNPLIPLIPHPEQCLMLNA